MTTPAGWYDDGSGRQRWWDGLGWTEHVAPEAPVDHEAPAAPEGPADAETVAPETVAPDPIEAPAAPADAPVAPMTPPYAASFAAPSASDSPTYPGATGAYPTAPTYPGAPQAPTYPGSAPTAYPGGPGYAGAPAYPGAAQAHPAYAAAPAAPSGPSVVGLVGLGLAVPGTVLSFMPWTVVIGLVLLGAGFIASIVGLFLKGRKWPAITGLIVSILGGVIAAIMALVFFVAAVVDNSDSFDGAAPQSSSDAELINWWDLKVGDCLPYDQPADDDAGMVAVVSCDQPHSDEVYHEYTLDDAEYPGDSAVADDADIACAKAFDAFVGIAYDDSELDFYTITPSEYTWTEMDDRVVQCAVFDYEGDVTGTLEGAAR